VGLQLPQFFVSTDGVERLLTSGEAAPCSEVRSDQAPDSDTSSSGFDPEATVDHPRCGHSIAVKRPLD
jgi:hypothetical protein